jgi:broad specificity phosphatase PhoE
MARVIAAIIRHGEYHQLPDTPSAHQPFPLNRAGEEHAQAAADDIARRCRDFGWRLHPEIDSSCMLRAWQTARIIADALQGLWGGGPVLSSHEALAERSVGCAANLSVRQIEQVLRDDPRFPEPPPGWKSDSHYRLPLQGAESLLDAGERVAGHLEARLAALPGDADRDVLKLFVGHGAAFRHAAFHMGLLSLNQVAGLSMYHGSPVYLEHLAQGVWRHLAGEWKVRGRNEQFTD